VRPAAVVGHSVGEVAAAQSPPPVYVRGPAPPAANTPAAPVIRPATHTDADAIWSIFHAVVSRGDTYVFDPRTPRDEAMAHWFRPDTHTYVAEDQDGQVVGTYILKPNQPALGSHVANAGFMVAPDARGWGVGQRMGEHPGTDAGRPR